MRNPKERDFWTSKRKWTYKLRQLNVYWLLLNFGGSISRSGAAMNVLIVDDDAQYRLLMRNILLAEGWDVFLANDGLEAMEKVKSIKMDFLISDVYMPLMDGIKFHKTVRSLPEYERVPFLFISGYD